MSHVTDKDLIQVNKLGFDYKDLEDLYERLPPYSTNLQPLLDTLEEAEIDFKFNLIQKLCEDNSNETREETD